MADAVTTAWTPRGSWAGILASGAFGAAGQPASRSRRATASASPA